MPLLGSKKSRRGCKRCKQRRVKCDEKIPCGSCVRRNEDCSFLDITPSNSSEAALDPALPSSIEDWILDLELMHHYTTALYRLGVRDNVVHLWRDYIPQQALKHPFLMHGLLALTALHLAFLRPEDSFKYLQLCDRHQSIALQTYRSILSSAIDPEVADALFALAGTISVSAMARSCAPSETAILDMEAVTELFVLTKGVKHIIHLSYQTIQQGPMAVMLEIHDVPESAEAHLSPHVSARFAAVRNMLDTYGLDPEALGQCQTALAELRDIYKNIAYLSSRADIEIGEVSRWQVWVSMGYVRLVQARNQPALVVLAYYAAAIAAVRMAWYAQTWAECALRGISQALDADMQHWLQWPMEQVQSGMVELGVRPLDEQSGLYIPNDSALYNPIDTMRLQPDQMPESLAYRSAVASLSIARNS